MTTIFPWLNCLSSHVIKIKDVLGGNYGKLDKLYNVNWGIGGLEHRNTLDDADVCIYDNVQGMLIPEGNDIAVYLRLKATKHTMHPQAAALKVGYLPDSEYKRSIKHATIVQLWCKDAYFNTSATRYLSISIVDVPLKLTTDEYKKYAIDI